MEKRPRASLPLLLLLLTIFSVGSWAQDELTCPLHSNNEDYFYRTPRALDRPVEGENPSPLCCKPSWATNNPFAKLTDKMEGEVALCQFKLNKMALSLCSQHQNTVAASHPVLGVAYVCDSYCNDLLEACGELTWKDSTTPFSTFYQGDGEYFCKDLFKDPSDNLTASVLPLSSRHCIDDKVRECSAKEGDFTGFYTECDVASVTREYHYQYDDDAECTGGEELPASKEDLPCNQNCDPGSFLPVGELECQECEAGYFSVGGGYLFEQWKDWPSEFEWETHCETNDGVNYALPGEIIGGDCKGWLVNDTFVESSPVLQDLQSSVLNMRGVMVREGSITFTFRVDAEPMFDGLLFKIDNETKMIRYSSATMETISFPVSSGMHLFTWVYFKDFSQSRGKDQALIESIQVLGAKLADTSCSHCNPGTYSEVGAAKCSPCGANTFSGWYGATECEACEASKFSYPGAVECSPRQPCVEDDYFYSFTPCTPEGRNKIYEFAQPMICDASDFTLPENENNVACAACNPGQYREMGSISCEICPAGVYSSIVGATHCSACPAGTAGVKELYYTQFDTFSELPGVSTWCVGECGTDGWRLMSDSIDSGVGHGSVVDSILQIETELVEDGKAHVSYSVVCKDFCKLSVTDMNATDGGYYTRYVFNDTPNQTFEMGLKKGHHQIQIVFSKYLENAGNNRENRMIVHDFNITGVKHAGATSCASCPAGTFAPAMSEFCSPCPPGTYSEEGAESCSPCEEGFYASESGMAQCLPCGAGTTSTSSGTGCDLNDCQFVVEEDKIMYDLSALISGQDMYGPIWGDNTAFFLSPCKKEHGVHSCVDANGVAIPTFACKQSALDATGVDVGNVQGYHALEDHVEGFKDFKRAGLLMSFEHGESSCNVSMEEGSPLIPYHSSILFLCEPNAGIGYPEIFNEDPDIIVDEPCSYKFKWESLYACPVCTSADYYPVYGACEDGVAIKSYLPNSYPNRCHSGEVPAPEEVPCDDSSVVCELGTYLPLKLDDDDQNDSENDENEECVPASPGHFSIGGGIIADVFDSWDTVPLAFGRQSSWVLLGDLIRSGDGDTELNAYIDVVESGSVEFDFKLAVYLPNDEDVKKASGFYFYVDNTLTPLNLTSEAMFTQNSVQVSLKEGRHVLTWLFVGGVSPREDSDAAAYVVIDKILITGTATSARSETPCREGTYQDLEGQFSCKPCPPDTYCGAGESMYQPCSPDQYALPGSSDCEEKEPCSMTDYSFYFTPCSEGQKQFRYEKLDPGCVDVDGVPAFPYANDTQIDCGDCPVGHYLEGEICVGCPLGQYLTEEKKCEDVPSGTYGETKITFFDSEHVLDLLPVGEAGTQKLPESFRTYCVGTCETDGWRMVGGLAQSGYYSPYSEVDSVLEMEVEFVQDGSVSFNYALVPFSSSITLNPTIPALPGFLFYIDGERQTTIYHPNSDEEHQFVGLVKKGMHNLTWIYHQPLQPTQHRQIFVSNLELAGSSLGSAYEYINCPAGTYSPGGQETCAPCEAGKTSAEGSSECELCAYDKYTDQEGSTECLPCGHLVNATEDRQDCDVQCIYYNIDTNHTYDVTPLSARFSVNDGMGLRYEISLCNKLNPLAAQCQVKDDTYVCISEMSDGKLEQEDGGHLQNVYFAGGVDDEHLKLVYSEGSNCQPRGQKSTEITFVCDPQAELVTGPTLVSREDCLSKFEWTHRSACPVCSEEDYEIDVGACVDGEKQIIEVRKSNCNGPEILSKKTESCRGSTMYFYILGALVVALLLLVAFFAFRNKTLSDRYETLVNSSNMSQDRDEEADHEENEDGIGDLQL